MDLDLVTTEPYKHDNSFIGYPKGGLMKSLVVLPKNIPKVLRDRELGIYNRHSNKSQMVFDMYSDRKIVLNIPNGHLEFTSIPYVNWFSLSDEDRNIYGKNPDIEFTILRDIINGSVIIHRYKDHRHINYYRSMISIDRISVGQIKIRPTPPQTLVAEYYTNIRYWQGCDNIRQTLPSPGDRSNDAYERAAADLYPCIYKWSYPEFRLCFRIKCDHLYRKYNPGFTKYNTDLRMSLICSFIQFSFIHPKEELSGSPKLYNPYMDFECGKYNSQSGKLFLIKDSDTSMLYGRTKFVGFPSQQTQGLHSIENNMVIEYPNTKFRDAVASIHIELVKNTQIFSRNPFTNMLTFIEVIE